MLDYELKNEAHFLQVPHLYTQNTKVSSEMQ